MSPHVSPDFTIKRGDRLPVFRGTCVDRDGQPANLTGATVRFYMRRKSDPGTPVVNGGLMTIVGDPTLGGVEYEWDADDTEDAEMYEAEVEATYGDGKRQTFPSYRFLNVLVHRDIS